VETQGRLSQDADRLFCFLTWLALQIALQGGGPMTKEEGRQFKERWQLVNEFIIEEDRQTPIAVRLKQLSLIFQKSPKSTEALAETEEVRQRWQKLKEHFNV
jgi:hypothetical protein